MGPLVDNLQQLGYVYGDNLLAAGVQFPPSHPFFFIIPLELNQCVGGTVRLASGTPLP